MNKIKSILVFFGEYITILVIIISLNIGIGVVLLSNWGDKRYRVGGDIESNDILDRKRDVFLEYSGNSVKISNKYIYSVNQHKRLLKIDFINDEYYLFNATTQEINSKKAIYGDKVHVVDRLDKEENEIYMLLLQTKERYPHKDVGKRMWIEWGISWK